MLGYLEPLTNILIVKGGLVVEVGDGVGDGDGNVRKYEITDGGDYREDEKTFAFPVQFLDAYLYKLAVDVYDLMAEDLSAIGSLIGREEEVSDA